MPTFGTEAVIDSGDLENAYRMIMDKGYGVDPGSKIVILANRQESEVIQSFRANVENNNSQVAKFDFVPSAVAPAYFTEKHVVGDIAASAINGVEVLGSYGHGLLIESPMIPEGYVLVVATGVPNSLENCVGFREHSSAAWQGLRLLPGNQNGHPLEDAFYQRSFGTGVRHRGAAAVALQVTTQNTYTAPQIVPYAR